jgi:hypothetical protein
LSKVGCAVYFCERSSVKEQSSDEQEEQGAESPQASQPPDARERTIERIAAITATKSSADMTIVASMVLSVPAE